MSENKPLTPSQLAALADRVGYDPSLMIGPLVSVTEAHKLFGTDRLNWQNLIAYWGERGLVFPLFDTEGSGGKTVTKVCRTQLEALDKLTREVEARETLPKFVTRRRKWGEGPKRRKSKSEGFSIFDAPLFR